MTLKQFYGLLVPSGSNRRVEHRSSSSESGVTCISRDAFYRAFPVNLDVALFVFCTSELIAPRKWRNSMHWLSPSPPRCEPLPIPAPLPDSTPRPSAAFPHHQLQNVRNPPPNTSPEEDPPLTLSTAYTARLSAIDANPLNRAFTDIFASRLATELGAAPPPASEGYAAVMRLVSALSARSAGDNAALTAAAVRVLDSVFPAWLPPAFVVVFSRPMPRLAIWLNAVVTVAVCQWLMGPSQLGATGEDEGGVVVEIERCRYLEESGCVGVCLHSCKEATETFFAANMGLPLYIEPDFEDYSCKFNFGVKPPPVAEQACFDEPCFVSCSGARAELGRSSGEISQPICSPAVKK